MNKYYEDDLRYNLRLIGWVLKIISAWPKFAEETRFDIAFRTTLRTICHAFIIFLLIPCILFGALEVEGTYDRLRLTGPIIFATVCLLKYRLLILREKNIRECLRHIDADWKIISRPGDRRIMLENAKFAQRLIIICAIFMHSAGVFYYGFLPIVSGKVYADDGNTTFWALGYPVAEILIDTRQSPTNEIFLLLQFITGFIIHSVTVGCCGLAALFAMHVCGQMGIVISCLNHLVDGYEDEEDTVDDRFTFLVRQHVRALNFISRMEDILQTISFVEVIGCTVSMCMLGYYCMMEWDLSEPYHSFTYITLLVSITFNIFIFCYIGEIVFEQSKKVGEVSYTIEWYRLPGKKRLDLILMIAMANSSRKMTAGNFMDLCFSSFGHVIKTACVYLNFLRTVTSYTIRCI